MARRSDQRSRRPDRPQAGEDPCRRRSEASRHAVGTAIAGSRARSISESLRRTEDARTDRIHAEDGKAAAKLATMFDEGTGVPLLVIPGLQGRWEWMRPA